MSHFLIACGVLKYAIIVWHCRAQLIDRNDLVTVDFVSIIIIAVADRQPVLHSWLWTLIDFFNPLVIQGLFYLP